VIFTGTHLRDIVGLRFSNNNACLKFLILQNERHFPFKIQPYDILQDFNPITAMFDLQKVWRQLNLKSNNLLSGSDVMDMKLNFKYLKI
jgi:hypothetical protein